MRYSKFLIIILSATMLVASQSCKKGFLEGVNDNPNSPEEVVPRVLLPGAEGNMAYAQGGDMARYTSILTQYITGANRQFVGYQQYTFTEEDFNNLWNNVYAATMKNFDAIIDINAATKGGGGYDAYDAVARILMAYTMGMTTDAFGDVPYTEAFNGNENLTPAYDAQQDVYASIQTLLSDAITILEEGDLDDDFEVPGSDDFIYGGDLDNWIALAHALKARYYIHLTSVDANAASNALNEVQVDALPDALYPFNSAGPGPWFQYIEQRDDIIYSADNVYGLPDPPAIAQMRAKSDPRLDVYIDDGSGYLGDFFAGEDAPVILMTDFEVRFIEAEAKVRLGDNAGAQTAFTAAIQGSMDFYGVADADATTYISANGTLSGDQNNMLAQIIYEKWIANYLSPESWVDLRRTDDVKINGTDNILGLIPNQGLAIPIRFIYPTNEHLYNPNDKNQNSDMFSPRLWWDTE